MRTTAKILLISLSCDLHHTPTHTHTHTHSIYIPFTSLQSKSLKKHSFLTLTSLSLSLQTSSLDCPPEIQRKTTTRCNSSKCGYRSPQCPDCCGVVQDMEAALFYLCCVHTTGCRYVQGCKVTTLETCCRGGGYFLCCANACGFPPDEKVPMGCGCCGFGMGFDKPMALEGTGLEWNENEICCHYICCCQHGAIFKQVRTLFPFSLPRV